MNKVINFRTRDRKLNDWLSEVFGEDVDGNCHIIMGISNDVGSSKFVYYNCDPRNLRELKDVINEGYLDTWLKHHINNYLCYVED